MKEHDMTFEGLINQFVSAITSEDTAEMATIMSHAQMAEFMGFITYEQCDAIVKIATTVFLHIWQKDS